MSRPRSGTSASPPECRATGSTSPTVSSTTLPSRAARLEGIHVDQAINVGSPRGRGSHQGNRGLVVYPHRPPTTPSASAPGGDPKVLTGCATGLVALEGQTAFGLETFAE